MGRSCSKAHSSAWQSWTSTHSVKVVSIPHSKSNLELDGPLSFQIWCSKHVLLFGWSRMIHAVFRTCCRISPRFHRQIGGDSFSLQVTQPMSQEQSDNWVKKTGMVKMSSWQHLRILHQKNLLFSTGRFWARVGSHLPLPRSLIVSAPKANPFFGALKLRYLRFMASLKQLDDGWPESVEEHVTLLLVVSKTL